MFYTCSSSPICLEKIPFQSSIKLGSNTLLLNQTTVTAVQPYGLLKKIKDMRIKCLATHHHCQMMRCFPSALDSGQSNNLFYRISAFFKHNFCLTPRRKINWPRLISFFLYFPAEIFQFDFNYRIKFGSTGALGQGVLIKIENYLGGVCLIQLS